MTSVMLAVFPLTVEMSDAIPATASILVLLSVMTLALAAAFVSEIAASAFDSDAASSLAFAFFSEAAALLSEVFAFASDAPAAIAEFAVSPRKGRWIEIYGQLVQRWKQMLKHTKLELIPVDSACHSNFFGFFVLQSF